jgi:hypothetical protein
MGRTSYKNDFFNLTTGYLIANAISWLTYGTKVPAGEWVEAALQRYLLRGRFDTIEVSEAAASAGL